jgi:copper resistance protein D
VDELLVVARAVHFAALAIVFGAPLFRLAVAPDESSRDLAGGRTVELAAGVMAILSALAWFVAVAAVMAGSLSDILAPGILTAVVWDTRFGQLWTARLVGMVAIIAIQAGVVPSRARDVVLVAIAGAVTASLAGTGHGIEGPGVLGPIHGVGDMVHLLCASAWIGGLFCLARLLHRAARGSFAGGSIGAVLRRFSALGYWLVALLVISGVINALVLLPRPDALLDTTYGQILLAKIALALIMVAIAAYNRFVLTADAVPAKGTVRLWRSVMVEQAAGFAVLATVALLGTIHPH